ncbi:hypothetical protein [Jeotgalibacillus haloalkalitolerans]|uniref:Uncharacterized protein n=1 Tax=Jeotgalibacillus haloalkalitolerans TaxID=3104292 RepID=A0ABU5KIF0_9BACL|nr:hypothetical protein [Jeotgalibacillus sp. HH7-29]MDZ5711006.1 hypothetical protein [Jeotgalibacillus sp. HH7-29]
MRSITLEKWSDIKVPEASAYPAAVTRDHRVLLIEEDLHQFNGVDLRTHRGDYVVKIIDGNEVTQFTATDFPFVPDRLDLFSDGTVLLVSSICWREDGWVQKNARRYSTDGECLDEFVLGTGLSALSIDDEDTIWVGYHEEGVFGNHGWDHNPVGSAGLVAFSKDGQIRWEARKYDVFECKALNVQDASDVYFHYTLCSWLVHLDHFKEIRRYKIETPAYIPQLMMLDSETMMTAEYQSDYVRHLTYENGMFVTRECFKMVDQSGHALSGKVIMRGNELFVFTETGIYKKNLTLDLLK